MKMRIPMAMTLHGDDGPVEVKAGGEVDVPASQVEAFRARFGAVAVEPHKAAADKAAADKAAADKAAADKAAADKAAADKAAADKAAADKAAADKAAADKGGKA